MWQCPKCGTNVANISSFCPKCGYSDSEGTGHMTEPSNQGSIWTRIKKMLIN